MTWGARRLIAMSNNNVREDITLLHLCPLKSSRAFMPSNTTRDSQNREQITGGEPCLTKLLHVACNHIAETCLKNSCSQRLPQQLSNNILSRMCSTSIGWLAVYVTNRPQAPTPTRYICHAIRPEAWQVMQAEVHTATWKLLKTFRQYHQEIKNSLQ